MTSEEPQGRSAPPADFESYYREHHAPIFRALALTVGDRDLAAEAVDEAMARTYQRWRSVGRFDNPPGWTYRVGLNWARSRFRKRRRETLGVPFEPASWDPEPSDPSVRSAVAGLPEWGREVVVLRYFLEWSYEEIAQGLGNPLGTVKSRLHRALAQLRPELEVEGFGPG